MLGNLRKVLFREGVSLRNLGLLRVRDLKVKVGQSCVTTYIRRRKGSTLPEGEAESLGKEVSSMTPEVRKLSKSLPCAKGCRQP